MKTEIEKLIPMSEIRDDVRIIAVSWAESNGYDWIGDKHKLASDIQNYSNRYAKLLLNEALDENFFKTKLLNRKRNIMSKLTDVLSNSAFTCEEVDITADKIFNEFIKPLLLFAELKIS